MKHLLAVVCLALLLSVSARAQSAVHIKDTAAGYQLGTGPLQKIGFYGAAPVAQVSATNDLLLSIKRMGLVASGTNATPLNLNGGAVNNVILTTGTASPAFASQPNGSVYVLTTSTSAALYLLSGTTWVAH